MAIPAKKVPRAKAGAVPVKVPEVAVSDVAKGCVRVTMSKLTGDNPAKQVVRDVDKSELDYWTARGWSRVSV